jgi:hypothetical protein
MYTSTHQRRNALQLRKLMSTSHHHRVSIGCPSADASTVGFQHAACSLLALLAYSCISPNLSPPTQQPTPPGPTVKEPYSCHIP